MPRRPLLHPKELTFDELIADFELAEPGFGTINPPVLKTPNRYLIRVVMRYNSATRAARVEWDYFKIGMDGLIQYAPQGYSNKYACRYRVTGMEEAVQRYQQMYAQAA